MASVPKVEDIVREAPFVFAGSVMKLGAASVASYKADARTAIVKVDRMLRAPEVVGNLVGTLITVHLIDAQQLKPGDQAIFFARGLVYAESIVVEEIAPREKLAAAPSRARQMTRVTDAVDKVPDLHATDHAAEANLVIVGKVTSVRLVPSESKGRITHHDPAWQEAVVQIESVEVGSFAQKTVAFLFPSSQDVKWHNVPKFQAGMEGVFILHKRQIEELKRESHVVLDPLDFHPRPRVEAIRKVLRANPKLNKKPTPTPTPTPTPAPPSSPRIKRGQRK